MGYVAVGVLIMGYGLSYLLFGLDYRYDYNFSDKGFVMNKRRNMPKWVNTATQALGWIGAVAVPMDPDLPEHVQLKLADTSQATLWLVDDSNRITFEKHGISLISLDSRS